jgi:uncharacterized protein YjbI with pentapeptide repeats
MANLEQLEILSKGVSVWNNWRQKNLHVKINLSEAELSNKELNQINLSFADLTRVNLKNSTMRKADLSESNLFLANLTGCDLLQGNLYKANLEDAWLDRTSLFLANLEESNLSNAAVTNASLVSANLSKSRLIAASLSGSSFRSAKLVMADLSHADIRRADFSNADLSYAQIFDASLDGANFTNARLYKADLLNSSLSGSVMVNTNLKQANIDCCNVYGIAAWDLILDRTQQNDLVITPNEVPTLTVDNLEVAQFIYLLLNSKGIRDAIDTITSKVVLILSRFTPQRKIILDSIRNALRERNYIPLLFDFDKPASRDYIETVSILAHISRFVIADFSGSKIVHEEVPHIVRTLAIPLVPILTKYSMERTTLYNLRRDHKYVLDTVRYKDNNDLLKILNTQIIQPAEIMANKLLNRG